MQVSVLKEQIRNNKLSDALIIFDNSDNYVVISYINQIAKNKKLSLNYIDTLDNNSFFTSDDNYLDIYRIHKLEQLDETIKDRKNLIIICDELNDIVKEKFSEYIVNIPKVANWCIEEFVKQSLPKLSADDIKWLVNVCKYDIWRIDNEINKLKIFNENKQATLFKQFKNDHVYSDLSDYTIFNFCDAIIKKDINTIRDILLEIDNCDIEPLGVVTLLYKNFKNIIDMQLGINPTAESLGLSTKQYYALKYRVGIYNQEQLINILLMLSEIDCKLKTGFLPAELILDYVLINILG